MVKWLSILFFLPAVSFAALDDDLVYWWSFEETSGVRTDEVSAKQLTDNNTVGYATGKVGNAIDCEKDNSEYLSVAVDSSLGLNTTYWSLQYWFRAETVPTTGDSAYIIGNSGTNNGYDIRLASDTQKHTFVRQDAAVSSESGAMSSATWYHIIFTFDGTNLRQYINGSSYDSDAYSAHAVATNAFNVCRSIKYTGRYYDGLLDELAFWSRPLTADEVADLYNSGNGLGYADLTEETPTSTTTTTTADVTELMYTFALYMSVLLSVLFAYIGYRFTKIFV